jgi:tetratricopeptide (TPR) repeat protein
MLLTAALIVKDEQAHLAACLRSIAPVVDEIVVVDTGSTDRTVKIARAGGARVDRIKWTGDFSAARNHALDLARGEWILYIDADECARRYSRARLRRELNAAGHVGYEVLLYPRPGFTPHRVVRLFRNDPRIRFEGIVHENILPGINRYRAGRGGRIGQIDFTLDHAGYSDEALSAKHGRYLPLLKRAVRADPARVYYWCHLGNVQMALGQIAPARRSWQRALDVVRAKGWLQPEDVLPYIALGEVAIAKGEDALALVSEGLRRFPQNAHLQWLRGRALMRAGQYHEAIAALESLIAQRDPHRFDQTTSYDERLFGVLPYQELAVCFFKLRDYRSSYRCYARALRAEPESLELRVKAAWAQRLSRTATVRPAVRPRATRAKTA